MKKVVITAVLVVVVALAVLNVNVVLKSLSGKSFADLKMADIVSLARGESGEICATCGNSLDSCTCTGGTLTCSYPGCHGKFCHDLYNFLCPCDFTGRWQDQCAF